jgi:hypothetical protein
VEFAKPAYYYSHGYNGDFSGNCLIGGLVYRGSRLGELFGAYIFGDYTANKIWAIRESTPGKGDWKPQVLGRARVAAFGTDPRNGDVLIGEFTRHGGDDIIQRLERAGMTGSPPPKLLSETGAFSDVKNMIPADGMVAYVPNVTFWSDYAVKSRWFMIPDSAAKMGFNATGNWTFPVGTVWMKHFDMEMRRGDPTSRRRLETRFLVKTEKGVYGITYRWRPDGSDADLISDTAQDEELNIEIDGQIHKQHWHYPSSSECLVCHTNLAGGPLGFNTWQMNGEVTNKDGTKVNQVKALADAGYFSDTVPDPHTLGAYAPADDTSVPLEWRVRSYLGANCVQCHQPGGDVQGRWDARPTTPTAAANLINGFVANPRGDLQSRWAVPGDLTHSQVIKRLKADGAPRMPPLATYELDPNGIKLMSEWINSLPKQ